MTKNSTLWLCNMKVSSRRRGREKEVMVKAYPRFPSKNSVFFQISICLCYPQTCQFSSKDPACHHHHHSLLQPSSTQLVDFNFQRNLSWLWMLQESSIRMGLNYIIASLSIFDEYGNDMLDMNDGSCFPRCFSVLKSSTGFFQWYG